MLVAVEAVGGLGLFLLGMLIMTQGLHAVAGDAMRSLLMRFTKSPLSGAVTGTCTTAILQSSSATTVAAVGFVGAGIISFPEALGIIFGANLGTTVTGWLVALLGFKLKIGTLSLPLIFVGAVLKLFAQGRIAWGGYALAGFGLIFFGISVMQEGMSGFEGIITPENLPADTIFGRLQLIALGIVATLITQSSSAGVAATLTLLYSGAIHFEQAAALVIGMDIGTTVTAAMATIGAPLEARRTGLSHVIYNLFTGIAALFLITPFTLLYEWLFPGQIVQNGEIALVAFHTTFNGLGVIAVIPFSYRFARMIKKVVRSARPLYSDSIEPELLKVPELALKAVRSALRHELLAMLEHIRAILGDEKAKRVELGELHSALELTQSYLDQIHFSSKQNGHYAQLIELIHTLDHMQRLFERCEEEEDRAVAARETRELNSERMLLINTLREIGEEIEKNRWHKASRKAGKVVLKIHKHTESLRTDIMAKIATDQVDVSGGTDALEAVRWLGRVSNHVHRITQHLSQALVAAGK